LLEDGSQQEDLWGGRLDSCSTTGYLRIAHQYSSPSEQSLNGNT
jgi:hypothetical protein